MGSDPYLYSHAHGGVCYRLVREAADIILKKGERPRVLDAALAVIRERGDLYERGGEMVRLAGDTLRPVTDPWLSDYFARHIRFSEMKFAGEEWVKVPADPPVWLCQQTTAKSGERGMRELNGTITAPTLRPDGSLLPRPAMTRPPAWSSRAVAGQIPEAPKPETLHRAFKVLWRPFAEFPFVSNETGGSWSPAF